MRRPLYNWHDHFSSAVTRREFLAIGALGAGSLIPSARGARAQTDASADLWATAEAILRRIAPPVFPSRTFDITRFGATTSGDATAAFRSAIDACARAGGGRVVVPRGRFETGTIHL